MHENAFSVNCNDDSIDIIKDKNIMKGSITREAMHNISNDEDETTPLSHKKNNPVSMEL